MIAVPTSARDAMEKGRRLGICITRIERPDIQRLKAHKSRFLSHLKKSVLEALSSGPQGYPGTQGPVLQLPREGVFNCSSTDSPKEPTNRT